MAKFTREDAENALRRALPKGDAERVIQILQEGKMPDRSTKDQISQQAPLASLSPAEAQALAQYLGIEVPQSGSESPGGSDD